MDTDRQRFKILFTEPFVQHKTYFSQYLQQQLGQRHWGAERGPIWGSPCKAKVSTDRCHQGTRVPSLEGTLRSR